MILPLHVDAFENERPYANGTIIGFTVLFFVLQLRLGFGSAFVEALVLDGVTVPGLVGHLVLHAGFFHLFGNMLFLWVFGNAVCSWTGNKLYPAIYLFLGLAAAAAHLIGDGNPAIGASGAINGVVGRMPRPPGSIESKGNGKGKW